jgi:DNA-binding MarR family transcriptional regulator
MERRGERELEILTAIAEGDSTTQRALAARLGVALGLTNLYLKRLAKKGYIKVADFPRRPAARKRLRYLLTARGIAEKSRLTYDHMVYALNLYRRARETLRASLSRLPGAGVKRVALYGTGEAAELAYLTLKEFDLEPLGIYASRGGGTFLGIAVKPVAELADESLDAVVVATFDHPEPHVAELVGFGVTPAKILTLRAPASAHGPRRALATR